MAIYKPSNFYPKLEEVDIEKEDNIFSCQINTDGEEVKAYKTNILSPDDTLLFQQFSNLKTSLNNKDFLYFTIDHYKLENYSTEFFTDDLSTVTVTPKLKVNFYSYKDSNDVTQKDYSRIKIQNMGFVELANNLYYQDSNLNYYYKENSEKITQISNSSNGEVIVYKGEILLKIFDGFIGGTVQGTDEYIKIKETKQSGTYYEQTIEHQYYDAGELKNQIESYYLYPILNAQDYCPYCLYHIKEKSLKCFAIRINEIDYNIVDIDYNKQANGLYTVILSLSQKMDEKLFNNNPTISIHLLNNFDYVWNIRLYQDYTPELNFQNNTKISTGYITGSTGNTFWYNIKNLDTAALQNVHNFNDKHYIEVIANENNSDFCQEALRLGQTLSGTIQGIGTNNNTGSSTNLLKNINFSNTYQSRYNPGENKNNDRTYEKVTYFGNLKQDNTKLKTGVSGVQLDESGNYVYDNSYQVYLPEEECDWRFTDYSLFFYHSWGPLSSSVSNLVGSSNGTQYIKLGSQYDSSKTTTLYQNVYNGKSGVKYQFSATFSGINYRTKNDTYASNGAWAFDYPITIKIFEKNNLNKYTTYLEQVHFTNAMTNNYTPQIDFTVPSDYISPVIQIQFPISSFSYINDKGYAYLLNMSAPKIIESATDQNSQIILSDNCVDLSDYNDNLMISITHNNNTTNYNIKKFYAGNHSVVLRKPLSDINKNDINIAINDIYHIYYKQREQIDISSENLGCYHNIGKIETKKDFKVNLKDGTNIQLYKSDNKNTLRSFFVEPNDDINVDDAYLRIPSIDGIAYCNTTESTTISGIVYLQGPFASTDYKKRYKYTSNKMTQCPSAEDIGNYPYCKSEDYGNYVKISDNSIFYKVVGYDSDTGEVRIAEDLPRILEETDTYEIWKKVITVDITGVYETAEATGYFQRIVPTNDSIDSSNVNGLKCCDISIMNNNDTQVFIQPDINLYSDTFHNAQLVFPKDNKKIQILPLYDDSEIIVEDRDKTINKLDNSQWLVQYKNLDNINFSINDQYYLMNNFAVSFPNNYFYAKGLGTINIKYCDYAYYKNNIIKDKTIIDTLPNVMAEAVDNIGIVRSFDCVFFAKCNNFSTSIKCYQYKLYDENMNLIKETNKQYDNELKFISCGLLNNTQYLLLLEIEDQLGYQYQYEHLFMSKYNENKYFNNSLDIGFDYNVLCNDMAIQLISYEDIAYKLKNNYNDYSLDKEIYIYKKAENDIYYQLVNVIDLENDAKIIQSKYWYTFIDYNVANNTTYQYYIVMGRNVNALTGEYTYAYLQYEISIKLNTWSLIDIEKDISNEYGYHVLDPVWNFKYNLEDENITTNLNINKIDTLGRYPMFDFSEKRYDSSSVTCLLGDVKNYKLLGSNNQIQNKYGYIETNSSNDGYRNINNAEKYLAWKQFISNGNLKLLKDIKGNKWIVQLIDNPNSRINVNSIEQVTTISFSWAEAQDSKNVSIIKDLETDSTDVEFVNQLYDRLSNWKFKFDNNIVTLTKYIGTAKDYISIPTSISINGKSISIQLGKTTVTNGNINGPFITNNNIKPINSITNSSSIRIEDNDMSYMFYGQTNLTSLFNIPENVDLTNTFVNCTSLTTLNFTAANYKNIVLLFGKDPSLSFNSELTINWTGCTEFNKYCDLCEYLINCTNLTIEGPVGNNWKFNLTYWDYTRDGTYITLTKYKGSQEDIYIPSKDSGKLIKVSNTCFTS